MKAPRFARIRNAARKMRTLARDNSAVALTEFAFAAPLTLSMGMLGTETAYFAITHMQMSQIAMQVADNASRVGVSDLAAQVVTEQDINATFIGAERLGESYDIFENGRVIISSLQVNADGGQWIAWQRCRGVKASTSKYGVQGTGATGTSFLGMGDPAKPVTASNGTAVMYVELYYTYDHITPFELFGEKEFQYEAAFNIRDVRDLSGLQQTAPDPSPVASCDKYTVDVT